MTTMRMVSKDIKILTTNVRGLRQDLKRKDILDNFKKYDIICLQETHLVQRDLPLFLKRNGMLTTIIVESILTAEGS